MTRALKLSHDLVDIRVVIPENTSRVFVGLTVVFLSSLGLPRAFALNPSKALTQYELSSWTGKNGLAQITVMSVAQTPDGFLWLGTEEGLVRYDGTAFTTFDERNTKGLPDRFIRSLATGPNGSLWIGTRSGIAELSNGVFRSFQRETDFYEDVYDLCATRDGGIWFSSANGLHSYKNGVRRVYTTVDGLPHNEVTAIGEGSDGSVWIGTRSGLVRLLNHHFTVYGNNIRSSTRSVNSLTVARNGDVWFGTLDGTVARWRQGIITTRWKTDVRKGIRVQCLKVDSDENLWIALSHLGLVRIHGDRVDMLTRDGGLPSNNPDWIFEDREHTLWIGLADAGLSSLQDGKFLNIGTPEGLSSNHVTSILQSRSGTLWAGTEDAGVNAIDGNRITTTSAKKGRPENCVLALLEKRDGSMWAGSEDGIVSQIREHQFRFLFDPRMPTPPRLPVMLEDPNRGVWFGYEVPAGLMLDQGGRVTKVPLKGRVRGLALDSKGSLWVASYGEGVVRVSPDGERVYTQTDGLSSSLVTSIFVDGSDSVWVGTALAGLNRMTQDRISVVTADQGLFDNTVGAIVEDDYGYLWLTSTRGVSRTLKRDLNQLANGSTSSIHSDSFNYSDGLRSQEFSIGAQPAVWKARDGRLWFATMGGIAVIDPGHLPRNPIAPQVHLELIAGNGKPVTRPNEMHLLAGKGRVEIGFTAPTFVSPEKSRVLYRLRGFESRWIEAGATRRATYTNLPAGKYRFEVRAANADGLWGPTAVLAFECHASVHQTYWFRSICVLAAAFLCWLVYRWRLRYLQTKNTELEARISARTADLQNAVELAEAAQQLLWDRATKDSLTGLLSRRAILDLLEEEVQCCYEPRCSSILLVDVDHFKKINDTHGHLTGDVVLQEVSSILANGVRDAGKVGRFGGEEILIILTGCSLADATRRADELRGAVSQHRVVTATGQIHVTCSVGVAEIRFGDAALAVLGEADTALYEAKAAGRNCVRSRSSGSYSDCCDEYGSLLLSSQTDR